MRIPIVILVLAVAIAAASLAGAAPGRAGGVTAITSCGQTVTTSAVLAQDLQCSGAGVVVGASGITIDLKGFTIRGDRDPSDYGIDDSGGYDGVSVKNGVLRNFAVGIGGFSGANGLKITSVVATGNTFGGVAVIGDSISVASSILAGNGSYGLDVGGNGVSIVGSNASGNAADGLIVAGDSASIRSSIVAGNGDRGVILVGDSDSVKSTTLTGNGNVGVVLQGNDASLTGNRADGNGFVGGSSDSAGRGVYVLGYTTAPTGKNVARGNDDPAQCSPSWLC
jgi:large repetitive protein